MLCMYQPLFVLSTSIDSYCTLLNTSFGNQQMMRQADAANAALPLFIQYIPQPQRQQLLISWAQVSRDLRAAALAAHTDVIFTGINTSSSSSSSECSNQSSEWSNTRAQASFKRFLRKCGRYITTLRAQQLHKICTLPCSNLQEVHLEDCSIQLERGAASPFAVAARIAAAGTVAAGAAAAAAAAGSTSAGSAAGLKGLSLHDCNFVSTSLSEHSRWEVLLAGLTSLQKLEVSNRQPNRTALAVALLLQLTQLTHLHLDASVRLTAAEVQALCCTLTALQSLRLTAQAERLQDPGSNPDTDSEEYWVPPHRQQRPRLGAARFLQLQHLQQLTCLWLYAPGVTFSSSSSSSSNSSSSSSSTADAPTTTSTSSRVLSIEHLTALQDLCIDHAEAFDLLLLCSLTALQRLQLSHVCLAAGAAATHSTAAAELSSVCLPALQDLSISHSQGLDPMLLYSMTALQRLELSNVWLVGGGSRALLQLLARLQEITHLRFEDVDLKITTQQSGSRSPPEAWAVASAVVHGQGWGNPSAAVAFNAARKAAAKAAAVAAAAAAYSGLAASSKLQRLELVGCKPRALWWYIFAHEDGGAPAPAAAAAGAGGGTATGPQPQPAAAAATAAAQVTPRPWQPPQMQRPMNKWQQQKQRRAHKRQQQKQGRMGEWLWQQWEQRFVNFRTPQISLHPTAQPSKVSAAAAKAAMGPLLDYLQQQHDLLKLPQCAQQALPWQQYHELQQYVRQQQQIILQQQAQVRQALGQLLEPPFEEQQQQQNPVLLHLTSLACTGRWGEGADNKPKWTQKQGLERLVSCCPNLQQLDLSLDESARYTSSEKVCMSPLQQLPHLTALKVDGFTNRVTSGFAVLTHLKQLEIIGDDGEATGWRGQRFTRTFTTDGMWDLAALRQLTRLDVSDTYVEGEPDEAIEVHFTSQSAPGAPPDVWQQLSEHLQRHKGKKWAIVVNTREQPLAPRGRRYHDYI